MKHIIIVGGGTAGWLSALYLSKSLNRDATQAPVKITLIESANIAPVGVGEATVPHIKATFKSLGLDEEELMVKCHATFKLGIKLINWSGLSQADYYWSPFDPLPSEQELEALILAHLCRSQLANQPLPFDFSSFRSVQLCEAGLAPRSGVEPPYVGKVRYAYHLDAGLLADYLKQLSIKAGVKPLIGTVLDVALDEQGFISHLITNNGKLQGDFFIDCSGFAGLLINQALAEPFISYADELLCDRAVAISVPYRTPPGHSESLGMILSGLKAQNDKKGKKFPQKIPLYTTSTALNAGWVWNVPLFTRRGTGYVYSSAFLSATQAEEALRAHLADSATDQMPARHLKMRVGRTRHAWVKNCVSIGLASGFIEPLESTAIYLIEVGLKHLLASFPDKQLEPALIDSYNHMMARYYEEIRDFIIMHYCTTSREDTPFWKHYKYKAVLPDTLARNLSYWRALKLKKGQLATTLHPFDGWSFGKYLHLCILAGMNHFPKRNLSDLTDAPNQTIEQINQFKAKLPSHEKYLSQLHRGDFAAYRQLFLGN